MTDHSGPTGEERGRENQASPEHRTDETRGVEETRRLGEARMSEIRATLRGAVPVEDAARVEQRRTHLLNVLTAEIERVPQDLARQEMRHKMHSVLKWGAAAVALLGLLSSGIHLLEQRGQPHVTEARVTEKKSPYAGKILETRSGEEEIVLLAGRTELVLQSETRLRVAEDTYSEQIFQLGLGHIRVSVPPGNGGRSVQVVTPHATISVKGTLFSVDLAPVESGDVEPRTRVSVEHGRVLVEHSKGVETLTAGQVWVSPHHPKTALQSPSPERPSAKPAQIATDDSSGAVEAGAVDEPRAATGARAAPDRARLATVQARVERGEPEEEPSAASSVTSRETTNPSKEGSPRIGTTPSQNGNRSTDGQESTLSQQNALLEAALLAEKRGDAARARQLVDRLMRKYPNSPLRASAQAVKRRLE